ncbi:hypothetical protein BOX15_Mlig022617g3 [Macrostomum lignano]|uniref:Uncharacterized protein n=1 Tax=Macrostomum lignano TaxID=282301 RepID=A0A267DF60_9PLAT|nr:hypothetical protein BOX15_Mlig022617g3 [Macrostomum lignano]
MIRSIDSQQVQPGRSRQHRHQKHHQQQPEQSCSNSIGDNATRRSSVHHSKHHHHHHHQHHQRDACRAQRHGSSSHRRRHQGGAVAGGDVIEHTAEKNPLQSADGNIIKDTNEDVNTNTFSVSDEEDAQTGLGDANSTSLAPHSSLIDQMLMFCAKSAHHQQPATSTAALACRSRRRKGHSQHQQPHIDAAIQQGLQGSSKSASQSQEDTAEAILTGGAGAFTAAKAETAAGKGLAKQWEVSKQFVMVNCFKSLSQRMRDLQQTEEPALAMQKLAVIRHLRRLTDSVRRIDLSKRLYSSGKRSKQAMAAVGLRPGALSADLLHKCSSKENEYQLYWMALLEKAAASLSACQDVEALLQQLEFAQELVDVQGFPLS